jgi:hypothetical protein
LTFEYRFFPLDLRFGRDEHGQLECPKGRVDLKVWLVHAFRRLRDPDEDFVRLELPEDLLPDDLPPEFPRPTAFLVVPDREEPRLLPRLVCPPERLLLPVRGLFPDSAWAVPAVCSSPWTVSPVC